MIAAAAASASWSSIIASGLGALLFGVLGAGLRAILKGDLVPRSVLADANRRADTWEAAWEKSQARLGEFDERIDAVVQASELNTQLLSELVRRAGS